MKTVIRWWRVFIKCNVIKLAFQVNEFAYINNDYAINSFPQNYCFLQHLCMWYLVVNVHKFICNNSAKVFSGKSRISQTGGEGGAPTLKVEQKNYYLASFWLKTAWKWKKLDWEGRASLAPPPLHPPMVLKSGSTQRWQLCVQSVFRTI